MEITPQILYPNKLIYYSACFFLFFYSQSVLASNLPDCPSDRPRDWDQCIGERTFRDGSKYSGEFIANHPGGEGTLIWSDGTIYKGQLQRARPEGNGTIKSISGEEISGE